MIALHELSMDNLPIYFGLVEFANKTGVNLSEEFLNNFLQDNDEK